jgi:hypothetical protein
MTHVPVAYPADIGTPTGIVGAIRSLHPAALPFFIAIVVFSTVAMANVPVARWLESSLEYARQLPTPEAVGEAAQAALPADDGAAQARVRTRCDACGIVEAIRRIDPVGALPATYEFTVRLRDGSTRLSSDASPSKWRAGDAIMLIGGASSATQH